MENIKEFPFAPGLSLDQARDTLSSLQAQYKDQIAEAKKIENSLGAHHTFTGYTGKR